MSFKLPRTDQRVSIVGHTGSGKTVFASWLLSKQRLDKMPWVVVDYKFDKFLNGLKKVRELKTSDRIPRKPGLYIVHPHPKEPNAIEDFLWKIWERGDTGVYVDETHMLPQDEAVKALLTQGRSKRIPMIMLAQRPRWTSRFIFSEANYHVAFPLEYPDDRRFVNGLFDADISKLPRFHSAYRVVEDNTRHFLRPVPHETIAGAIEDQLKPNTLFA